MRVKALKLQAEKNNNNRPQQRRGSEAVLPSHNTSLQMLTLSYFVCLLLWAEDGPTRLTRNIYKKPNAAVHARPTPRGVLRFLFGARRPDGVPVLLTPAETSLLPRLQRRLVGSSGSLPPLGLGWLEEGQRFPRCGGQEAGRVPSPTSRRRPFRCLHRTTRERSWIAVWFSSPTLVHTLCPLSVHWPSLPSSHLFSRL